MNQENDINYYQSSSPTGKRKLSNLIFIIPFLTATITATTLAAYYSVVTYESYKREIGVLKKEFPVQQQNELKFRILSALDYIKYSRTNSDVLINNYIHQRTKTALHLLTLIIPSSQSDTLKPYNKASDSLFRLSRHTALRFIVTDPYGHIYLPGFDSVNSRPESNGKLLLALKNSGPVMSMDEGWITFAKSHRNTGVIHSEIGSTHHHLYLLLDRRDSLKLLQEAILDTLSRIRYESGEYIFINTFEGKGLITKGVIRRPPLDITTGSDTNWIRIFGDQLKFAQQPGGGYIRYKWQKDTLTGYTEKISYINGVPEWRWILGTGMHSDDIVPLLQKKKDALYETYIREFIRFIIFVAIAFVLIYLVTRLISKRTTNSMKVFVRFFRNAANSQQHIDESRVYFKEFHTLAVAANQMMSDREKIMKDLSTEQSRLKYIIDSIPDIIFIKDINSRFVGGNRAFEKFIGKKSADIIGLSEYDLFSQANAESYLESDKRLLETLEPVRSTEWVSYPDGQKVLSDTLKTLYFDNDGKVLGFIGISRDITEMEETRQRLIMAKEKAEESDRLKTAFLANMSHEIRTPMNAIIGFSDLLSDEQLSKEEREDFISKIKQSGESLMNIINDIIDISKIEAGQLKMSDSDCNVDKVLADLYGTFFEIKNRGHKPELELKLNTDNPDQPLITVTDPLRLQQVLTNLLSNALKFTEFGSIEFGYKLENNNIHFSVKDTGIGILRSKQPLLFQRFSQVETSKTRKYGGTGLGLAISKNIVELMGGTIWMESEPGRGSIFHFSIPYRPPQHSETEPEQSDNQYQWKGKKILIAEDIEQNFLLMEAVLRFTQVTLLHASNGQIAIDLAKENPDLNLILMDIQLPVKTGYEAIQEILQFNPAVPIISFTAYALPREREKSLEAGCVDFLNKPIKPNMLLNVIRKYML